MNKNKFLCLLCIFVNLCLSAQTTGNKAFQLNVNNGDAYLNCGDIIQLNNTPQYTIEMWVNVTLSNLPDRFIMFKKEQTDEKNRIKVQIEKNGQIYVMQSNGADGAFAQTPVGTYPESGWHHIALVYDGEKETSDNGAMTMYIDGIKLPLSNATFKSTTGNIDAPFVIGGPALNVQYDEIKIWNKALSASTIIEWKGHKVLSSHPEKESLVAYYDFQNISEENNIPDIKGNYPATFKESEATIIDTELSILESLPIPVDINNGFKINVNNGDAYLNCGNINELNNADQYTIETWVNVNLNELPDRFVLFKKEQTDEKNRIKVQIEKNGQIYVMQSNGADGAFAQTPVGTYPESGWHHIALVYDGEKETSDNGAMTMYIDGIKLPLSNATFKSTTGNIDAPFVVGGPSLNVEYDEIRIWNEALTPNVINDWKNYKIDNFHPNKTNLIVYYDFEDVSNTQVNDRQGNYPAIFKADEAEIKSNDLKLYQKENIPTTIENIITTDNNNLQIISTAKGVKLISTIPQTLHIYNISGILIRSLQINVGTTTITDLPKGLYIVNKQKIIIQ